MNTKDKDVNLGVGMGSTNFCIRTKLLSNLGAGVNADSRVKLAFATSDPLSELVWSPHNGLSVKCASSAAADKKPFLLWNVGPSSAEGLSLLQNIGLNRSGDGAVVDQGNLTMSPTVLDAENMIIDKATLLKASENHHTPELCPSHRYCDGLESDGRMRDEADKKDAIWEDNCRVDCAGNPFHPQNVQTDVIGNQIAAHCEGVISSVIPDTPLKKQGSSAENESCRLTEYDDFTLRGADLSRKNALPAEGSLIGSRIGLDQENGIGKALSDGDKYRKSSNDEDDSHDSAESCNSAGLSPKGVKGVKRQINDKGVVVLGSKRMKMQIHESRGSTSVTRPDTSFINWISNMKKGLSDCNKQDSSSPLALACLTDVYGKKCPEKFMCFRQQDSASISMGFQTIFQSLYCREEDAMNNGGKKIAESLEDSREHTVDDKRSPENLTLLYDRNCGNLPEHTLVSCNKEVDPTCSANLESSLAKKASSDLVSNRTKEGVIAPHALHEDMKIIAEKSHPDTQMATCDVLAKGDPRINLWISRLSSKTPSPRSDKGKEIAEETIGCSSSIPKVDHGSQMKVVFPIEQNSSGTRGECADSKFNASMKERRNFIIKSEASFEVNSISKICPMLPSQRFSSETMASVFARRLDALRHITSSKTEKSLAFSDTCFFCGGCHDVHECPNITKSELEDLLLKLSILDGVEESYLCIRSSQSDHWAVSCPLAPCSKQWISEEKATDFSSSRKPVLGSTYQDWKMEISATERQHVLKDNRTSPRCDVAAVLKSQIFDAIKKLRLTRADILRWMNSNIRLSHLNGFFLRLRLGKLEAGVEGGSYYLACITGDGGENDICRWNKCILVNVGGIKSYVASQYVSNHDFMEDEMEAWWCTSVELPSLADLNSKLNHRKTLGF